VSEQVSSPGTSPTEQPKGNGFTRWFKGQSAFGKFRIIGVALVVVIGGPIAYFASKSDPSAANVGDCLSGQTAPTMKKVDCTDATAQWVVVGRLSDKTEADFNDESSCAAFPTTEFSYWKGTEGETGFILCLAKK
jgi:hypothetical protein